MDQRTKVYYFSSAPFALSNLSLKRLKISRYADLNDPFELLAANLENADHRNRFAAFKHEFNKTKGLICFSQSWSNPLLWGHYADKHTGIALGFDVPNKFLADVIYRTERIKVKLDPKTKEVTDLENLFNQLCRTKSSDWMYEEERRLFVDLDLSSIESGMFFQDFSDELSLVEVILGLRCELPIEKLRTMIANSGLPSVKVFKARMDPCEFRITEDLDFRPTTNRS